MSSPMMAVANNDILDKTIEKEVYIENIAHNIFTQCLNIQC